VVVLTPEANLQLRRLIFRKKKKKRKKKKIKKKNKKKKNKKEKKKSEKRPSATPWVIEKAIEGKPPVGAAVEDLCLCVSITKDIRFPVVHWLLPDLRFLIGTNIAIAKQNSSYY